MKAYICVYRHPIPRQRDRCQTELAGASNHTLRRFLEGYDDPNCFYDWGDDPSFFAASELLGDVRDATWGVCRPNVRNMLRKGDYIAFFCAKAVDESTTEYYYIGVGTVDLGLTRQTIWLNDQYARYRDFFNILARPSPSNGEFEHFEVVHPYHKNWRKRCNAPYWLFDREQSQFNIANPLHAASYTETEETIETWHSPRNQQVARLETLLFPPSAPRRHLRTNNYLSHPYINLLTQLGQDADLKALRSHLLELAAGSSQAEHGAAR